MQMIYPKRLFVKVAIGVHNGLLEMNCQSSPRERTPRPSVPFDPPKMLVMRRLSGFAKQNTLTPVRMGIKYSGKTSQKKITTKISQKKRRRCLVSPRSRWSVSSKVFIGRRPGHTNKNKKTKTRRR